ncbi:MAG: 1-deoxy-D-xylulose-5-phosphate reductoisomerase [Candidatus Acidiferrales bacterium]
MKKIAMLGSTGSIGRQTTQVIDSLPGEFQVVSLAAGSNISLVAEQVKKYRPLLVSVGTEAGARELCAILKKNRGREDAADSGKRRVSQNEKASAKHGDEQCVQSDPEILFGAEGIERVATHPDVELVISAAVGVVGLPATYKAIEQGKSIALANKEVLVAAGEIVMAAVKRHNVALLPVDSEHNAIHQCLRAGQRSEVKRLVLTASGGPFRNTPIAKMNKATPKQALAHPNWKMGNRITIDSATLMNKGFEVIEARWLFDVGLDQIRVVIHPQSTIHSMVEFVDGSILAQLGATDMRIPIRYALTYPERAPSNDCALDWSTLRKLEFEEVPARKFPCLALAKAALKQGGPLPCALNAADEIAVAAFLDGKLSFSDIAVVIERVLERMPRCAFNKIDDVLAADGEARRLAREEAGRRKN